MASDSVTLVSPYARTDCILRLRDAIDSPWSLFGSKPVIGSAGPERVRLYKRLFYRNSFRTNLFGSFVESEGKTRLECRFGAGPWSGNWLVAAVGVFIATVAALQSLAVSGRIHSPGLSIELGLPVIGALVVFALAFGTLAARFGCWLARSERQFLIDFVCRTIDASQD